MDTSTQTIQVRGREPRRRFRTVEEKRRIVEEALEPGASVARVARAHGVNANQLLAWRRLYLQGQWEAAQRRNAPAVCGTIQIELPKGTIRIVGRADPASLHAVLEYLAQ